MVPNRIKHIIWDWNGTLLNDTWLCIECINKLLIDRNIETLNLRKYHEIFDFPVYEYYRRAGFDFTNEPFEIPALEFIELYDNRKYECHLQPNSLQVLETIRSKGLTQSLLSASERRTLREMTDFHGITDYFDVITGLNDHYAKGKADLALLHLSKLPYHPSEIVMVGDTCHDQEVAEVMGVHCLLYPHGHFPAYRLITCGSTMLDSLMQLPEWIEKSQTFHA